MSAADKLAQVLAEHDCYRWQVDLDGPADAIVCGCGTVIPEQDAGYAEDWHRAHVAAVVLAHLTAEGWAQGREEWGVRRKLSPIRTTTWAMPSEAAAREETEGGMRPDLMEVVRRRVTDWEPAEGERP